MSKTNIDIHIKPLKVLVTETDDGILILMLAHFFLGNCFSVCWQLFIFVVQKDRNVIKVVLVQGV